MIGRVAILVSLLLSASYAQTSEERSSPANIVASKPCFAKGETIRASFENVEGIGIWIGLYSKDKVDNFETLPAFSEQKLLEWILTCNRTDNCPKWPSEGNIEFQTDDLANGEYVITVSGDRASLTSQAYSESFTIDANCPDRHNWMPARISDQRSPCPFLNTAANHGFLNRNGTNIDVSDMAGKLESVYSVAAEFLHQGPIQQMMDCNQTYEDENGVTRFDLDILFDGKCEEHEASLVRPDSFFGFEKSKDIDDSLLNNLLRRNRGETFLTFNDVMDYQAERIMTSRMINPETEFREFDIGNMGVQGLFLFLLSGDKSMWTVEKNRLYFFLLDEKLPDEFVPGSLSDTPFNPMDASDFLHDRFMQSMENIEMMTHTPIEDDLRSGPAFHSLRDVSKRDFGNR
jgi:hypothetical protein